MMNKSIDDCFRQYLIAEYMIPLAKLQVGRNQDASFLTTLGDHLENPLC